jgi:hypothetical protein
MTSLKTGLAGLSVVALALTLAGCGSDDPAEASGSEAEVSEGPTEEPTQDSGEESGEEPGEEAGEAGATPGWALPAAVTGDQIASLDLEGDVAVEVYQAGTTTSPSTGSFVDPDTNKPLVEKGDELVVLDYVVTNNGSEPVLLGPTLVDVTARYADWPYLQGMDGVSDDAVYEEFDVHEDGLDTANYVEPPYELAPGEAYSSATNFEYQQGGDITFEATLVPVDEAGELLTDESVTAEASATTP